MKMKHSLLIAIVGLASQTTARTFTVVNACPFTIWPAIFTDLNVGQSVPDHPTGWEAPPDTAVTFNVPDDWKSGRIWGRRNCNFTVNPGPTSCAIGACNGGLECDPHSGTGVPPVTLAEWTLDGDGNRDFYDVSLVDGYGLPMRIDNNVGCPIADCPVDLGPVCPERLRGPTDASGFVLGCLSSCMANLDGNQSDSPNCCSGSYSLPAACPPSGVAFYSFYKDNCPNAYAYAYDEGSGTALWTCDSGLRADYTLTFCPPILNGTQVNSTQATNSTSITDVVNGSMTVTLPISEITGGLPTNLGVSPTESASGFSAAAKSHLLDWKTHVMFLLALWVLLR